MRRISTHVNTGYTSDLELTGSGAEKQIIQAKFVQRLFWDSGDNIWKIFDHSVITGNVHTNVGNGIYVPDFLVRAVKIEGSSLWLAYDMPGTQRGSNTNPVNFCRSQFNNRQFYPMQVTALFLDVARAQTTCTAVELYG